MEKNNEQKNNKTPEMKPKQDSFRPWLKLIPAAAVFAAVCVTCYQADKSQEKLVHLGIGVRYSEHDKAEREEISFKGGAPTEVLSKNCVAEPSVSLLG